MVNILIVEDENIVAFDLKFSLEHLGYNIAGIVSTGEEAYLKAHQLQPDIILMDISLEGNADGIETAKRIMDELEVPIIYVTANSDPKTLMRAKITHPFGYILKPFEQRELHTTVEMALYKFQSEKRLKADQRWFATVLKSIADAVIATDLKGLISFVNPVAEELTGFSQQDALGKPLHEVFRIINEDTGQAIESPADEVLRGGKTVGLSNHAVLVSAQGKEIPIDDSASPIRDEKGNMTGVVLVFRNIEERKILERKQRSFEKNIRNMIEHLPDAVIVHRNYTGLFANSAAFKLLNLQGPEEIIGKNVMAFVHTDYQPVLRKRVESLINSVDSLPITEVKLIRSSGEEIDAEITASNIVFDGESAVQTICRDIGDRVRMMAALKESEERFRFMAENTLDVLYNLNYAALSYDYMSPAIIKLTGYTLEEINKTGFASLVEKSETYKGNPHTLAEVREALAQGWDGEFRSDLLIKTKSGELRWLGDHSFPRFDSRGELIGSVGILTDISDRKKNEAELISAKEAAENANKLKTDFLAQMSHEIRTPINTILSFTSLLRDELEDKIPADLAQSFKIIDNGGRRLTRTIDMILTMSQLQSGVYELSMKPVRLINDVLKVLYHEFSNPASTKSLEFTLENQQCDYEITGDLYTLTQLFQNLIDNAIKYTHNGSVGIKVSDTPGGDARVDITDTGIGISDAYLPILFSPFSQEDTGYTRRFEGNGLGLSLVKKYADLNNVEINVSSRKGKGSVFSVIFPAALKTLG